MSWNIENKKILVTGGGGFLGKQVVQVLLQNGAKQQNIFVPRSSEYDLRKSSVAHQIISEQKPQIVFHLAARLAGIGGNRAQPASYFFDNIMMGINIIEACRKNKVERFVNIGSVCSYPKHTPVPFKEENIWNGYPDENNAPYGIAKKAVMVYAEAVQRQYGMPSVNLLLTNLYGPDDDFREATSHVIPALVRKFFEATTKQQESLVIWGDGSPTRDFIFVTDAAKAIVKGGLSVTDAAPVNIGSGIAVSIKEVVQTLQEISGFTGEVKWDATQPNGQPERMLDISKAQQLFGFAPEISLREGIQKTYKWFAENYENIELHQPKYADE